MDKQKKVLYLDLFPVKAHLTLNKNFISAIKNKFHLTIYTQDKYFKSSDYNNLILKTYKNIPIKIMPFLMIRIRSLYAILKTFPDIKKNKYNSIFIPTFETLTFCLYIILFSNLNKFYLVHHLNIDELKNPIKKYFFKKYMNKVNHIVFEEYFKDYLVEKIGIKKNLVFVLNHPLMKIHDYSNKADISKKLCIGLSNSNEEALIDEIIEFEEKNKILEKGNAFLVLKSKYRNYDSKHLKVLNSYLSIENYNTYICKSSMFLMLHSKNHIYRASGFLYDGLSNKKIVIGNNVRILLEYSHKFPHLCKIGKNAHEMLDLIVKTSINEDTKSQFDLFLNQHSNDLLQSQLINILNDSLKE